MGKKARTLKRETHATHLKFSKDVSNLLSCAFEYHKSGELDKAQDLYTHILTRHSDHPDALHLLGVVSYQNGDMDTAEKLIKKAVIINPHIPDSKCNLGNVLSKQGRHEEAISCYRDAIRLKPDFTEAYNNLGACLRRASKIKESIECYRKALEINPDHDAAHNNLGNIFRETGEIDQALFHYQQAVRLNPHNVEAYMSLGNTLSDKKDFTNAILCFKKVIELNTDFAEAHLRLGMVLKNIGKVQDAITSFNKALDIKKDYADAYHLMGITYHETGRFNDACSCFRKDIEIRPEFSQAHNRLGIALHFSGKPEEAISCYQKALEIDPEFAEAYNNLGMALHDTGKPDEAVLSYHKAIALDSTFVRAYNNLGGALLELRKTEEAIESFEQSLQLNPDFVEAYNNLGIALKIIERYEDSHIFLQKALAINPSFSKAYINSGNTFREQCRYTDALSAYKKALEITPNSIDALTEMAFIFCAQGKIKESIHCYQRALEIDPDHTTAYSDLLLSLHYQDNIDFQALSEKHKRWGNQIARTLTKNASPHPNKKAPIRRLRIGYVSPDFRKHSVAYFIEPILSSHDESAFEVFCYSDVGIADEITGHMQTLVRNWRDVHRLRDDKVERMIWEDKIDILIDLAGHTAKNRLSLFAREPAPIQVTYLGYPNTTGLTNMHYRITDALADPDGKTDHLFTENLLRLPRGFLCYRPPVESPDIVQPPIMKSGNITFGSFNNRAKITPGVVKVWSEILKRVPGSRLVLKSKILSDPEVQQSLSDTFVQEGVSPEQVEFHGSIPNQYDHLTLYNSIDIALDTFPYNGTTTTCEALWMGVPVIVLKGDIHMSRVGVSLLTNAGVEELIADTPDDYVKNAVDLANNPARLIQLREKQRDILASSPLMDAYGFTRDLENAYRRIWRQWCNIKQGKRNEGNMREDQNHASDFLGQDSKHSLAEQSIALTQEGEDHFNAGNIEDAQRAFNKALEINPENVTALNNLGVLSWHKGDVQKAVENLQLALKLNPSDKDAAHNLQEILKAQDNAIEHQNAGSTDKTDQPNKTCFRVNIKGGIQVCVPPSIQFMTPYILVEQEDWFEDEIHYVRKLLQEGMKVIDIGANYGLYTHSMAKIIAPSGKLWAFEPTSLTAAFLRKSISANQMTNITLIQAGLSEKKGTAKISLNSNPELNAITLQPDSNGEYETVELLSLDECEQIYGWDDIDFIKLDAEGQEHNIIMGGRHFLSAHSPLIMFELKHGSNVNSELIHDFLKLGYQLFRLIPGPNILAPIDLNKPFDPFQLNLFCCKADRAKLLQEKDLLITEYPSPNPISDASLWQKKLKTMPYFKVLQMSWASIEQGKTIPGWDHYKNALNYYVMAHSDNQAAHSRYASLYQAWEESSKALTINGNMPRMLTHIRIQSELGKRDDSLHTVERILNLIQTEKIVMLSEPFIPVSARFDHIIPTEMNKWILVSILEYREKAHAFSSFYSGSSSLDNLEVIKQLGYQSPEMERRRQLIRMRYGLQREPIATPILSSKTQDNLNPELWNTAER